MKKISILIFMVIFSFAKEPSEDTKLILKVMEANQKVNETKFEAINKQLKKVDERFDRVDKRFESIDKKFDRVDKRFESIDKKFDRVDKRFDDLYRLGMSGFAILITIFIFMVGYLLKERNSIKSSIKDELEIEVENRLKVKADKKFVDKIASILEDIAKSDTSIQEILEKHHFKYQV